LLAWLLLLLRLYPCPTEPVRPLLLLLLLLLSILALATWALLQGHLLGNNSCCHSF
jgi:hypothetical protein